MPSYLSSWFPSKDNAETSTQPKPPRTHDDLQTVHRPDLVSNPDTPWSVTRSLETPATGILMFAIGAASGAGALLAWRRWGMRLRTADWITPNELARRRWVRGVVTSVGDADDFRLYHTPGIGWRWPFKVRRVPTRRRELKDQTIHVRIAGVDAPEGAHYGRPGQPHAEESLAWLRKRILGKTLLCQFVRKDHYGRVVGIPLVPRPFLPLFLSRYLGSPLAFEMLRAGAASVYEESGAEYGPWGRDAFVQIEEEAKAGRRGMWKDGVSIETPGEYKKRYAIALQNGTSPSKEDVPEDDDREGDEGRKSRLLSRLSALLK